MTALDMLRLHHHQRQDQPRQQQQRQQRKKKQQQQQQPQCESAGQPRAGDRLCEPQCQKLRRLRPRQEQQPASGRSEATPPASRHRSERWAFLSKKLTAAAAAKAAADLLCGLTWVGALAWEACHLDGLLLLVAAGPVACTTFAASVWRANAFTSWHLLFSWQAALPLLLLMCCCVAVYCVARGRQQNGGHTAWQHAGSQGGRQLQQSSASVGCCCCFSSPSVFGGPHLETSLSQYEPHHKHKILSEQQPQQQHPQDSAAEDSQQQQQQKLPQLMQPQWMSQHALSEHQMPNGGRRLDTRERTFWAKPETFEENNSSGRLAGAVYYKGECGLDDDCSSFISSGATGTTDDRLAGEAKIFSTAVVSACAAPVAADEPSSSSSSVTNRECLTLYGKTEAAAYACSSKLFSTVNFARVFVRRLSTRFSSLAKWRSTTVRCRSRPKPAHPSVCHCCAFTALEGSHDERQEENWTEKAVNNDSFPPSHEPCSSSSRDSSESQPKKNGYCDVLTVHERGGGGGGAREPAAISFAKPEGLSSFPRRATASSCESYHKDAHAWMQCGLAAPARNFLIFPPSESSACHPSPSSADASQGGRHILAADATLSETFCCTGASAKKASQHRRGGPEGWRGHCASSAVVAALLLPMFFCCWFPVVEIQDTRAAAAFEAALAKTRGRGGPADACGSAEQLFGGMMSRFSSFSDGGGYPTAPVLLFSGHSPATTVPLLRVILSLLPASLVAGSIVSLLLWYSPAAAVRLEEIVGLIGVYSASSAATRWYSPQQIAAAAADLPLVHSREPTGAPADDSNATLMAGPRFLYERSASVGHPWTERPGGAPSPPWEDVCFHSMCTVVVACCMALQLIYFHGCFRRAPGCFSLVEGTLVGQLATGLTYLCVAYIYCCRLASHGKTRLNPSGESWFDFYSHSGSSTDELREGVASDFSAPGASTRSPVVNATTGCPAPAEAGWKSFAAHVWLLLLVLIACTLVITAFDNDKLLRAQRTRSRKKIASAAVQKERANRRAEEKSTEDASRIRRCRKRVALLLFHFLLALVVYLCDGSVVDLDPPCSFVAEIKLTTRGSRVGISNSSTTRRSRGDPTSNDSSSDDGSNSSGDTRSSWPGTHRVVGNAEINGKIERPVAWLLHFISGIAHHMWLLVLWFSLSVVGIPFAAATAARADLLESTASSSFCLDCTGVPACCQEANTAPSCGKSAANEVLSAGMEESTSNKRSARLLKLFVRKLFHFLLVAVVTTGCYAGAYAFTAVALCGLLWILVFCEYLRVSGVLPKLSSQLTAFFNRFVDCRDKNGLFLTHMYLLLGVALPFVAGAAQRDQPTEVAALPTPAYTGCTTRSLPFESLSVYYSQLLLPEYQQIATSSTAACSRTEDVSDSRVASTGALLTGSVPGRSGGAISAGHAFEEKSARISLPTIITMQSLLGLLLVGIGDAVAALVGVRWGGKKMPFTRSKTYLGTAAFFAAPALLLLLFMVTTSTTLAEQWLSFRAGLYAMALATLFEAYTPDIDNCILSLFGVVAYNGALSFIHGWQNLEGEP